MIRSYALAGVAAIALTISLPQISKAQTADALLTAASQCSKLDECISVMLKGGAARQTPVMQMGAARIADMPKPEKGNRNLARELNAKALDAIKAKDYATASTMLQQANQADPRDVEVLSNLEFALVKLGKGAEAERVALATLLIDPKRTSAWAPLGEAYDLQGKKDVAVSALLVAYEFSGNREKTLSVYTSKADTEERPTMKAVYKAAVDAIQNNRPLAVAQATDDSAAREKAAAEKAAADKAAYNRAMALEAEKTAKDKEAAEQARVKAARSETQAAPPDKEKVKQLCKYSYNGNQYDACFDTMWMGYCILYYKKNYGLGNEFLPNITSYDFQDQGIANYHKLGLLSDADIEALNYVKKDQRICIGFTTTKDASDQFWGRLRSAMAVINRLSSK
jgi:hypothetical protein